MNARVFVSLLLLLGAGGCASYRADLQAICDAPKGVTDPDPIQRAQRVGAAIEKNVHSKQGRELLLRFENITDPADRAAALKTEAAQAGIHDCAMLKFWSGEQR